MNISKFKLLGSLVVVILVSAVLATTIFAAPATPTPRNAPYGYGWGMMGGYHLDLVAKLIGTTREDIVNQLQQGKSLVQIAQGKATEQQLIDTLLAPEKDMIQLRVKYGYITQDEADAWLQQAADRIKTAINATGTGQGFGGYGYGCGGFGGMMGGYGGMMGGFRSGRTGGFGGWGGMMGRVW
ncbi:MAG: hypothetical protein M1343_01565 [Chloroflexi bacterium]|nr:hypothetical protein [Chloroflexota bacterium]MDA8188328.1 hypothetical protein [Dehalococcoidales bacterium]